MNDGEARGGSRILCFMGRPQYSLVLTHGFPKCKPQRLKREKEKALAWYREYHAKSDNRKGTVMKQKTWFEKILDTVKDSFEFRLETIILDITEQISKRMKKRQINRTQLAKVLDVSPAAVTKILNGSSNFTLKTLLSLGDALDLDLEVEFRPKEISAQQGLYEAVTAAGVVAPWRVMAEFNYVTTTTTLATTTTIHENEYA